MRTIGQYVTENPKQLSTQLSEFEQNVVTETATLKRDKAPRLISVDDDPVSPRKTYTVGQIARIDTDAGAVFFNLTPPADGLPGQFAVVQISGASGFTAVAVNCRINGGATYAPAAGLIVYRFEFDGKDFWN